MVAFLKIGYQPSREAGEGLFFILPRIFRSFIGLGWLQSKKETP